MLLLGKSGALCPGLPTRVPEDLDIRRAVAAAASASFAALTTDSLFCPHPRLLLSSTKRDSSARERERVEESKREREREREDEGGREREREKVHIHMH